MAETKPFLLTVQGKAEISHPAERAIIAINVQSEGLNKASVSDEVITTVRHLESILKPLAADNDSAEAKAAAPLAHWSKTSLSSTSWVPYNNKSDDILPRQYRATVNFDIRFQDFKALGAFGTKVSSLSHMEVQNVEWVLTEKTEKSFQSSLRKQAAESALRKAQDYCDAFGCVNLRPIELTDGDVTDDSGMAYGRAAPGMMRAAGAGGGDDMRDEDLEFDPQEVKVNMEVTVKFHADHAK